MSESGGMSVYSLLHFIYELLILSHTVGTAFAWKEQGDFKPLAQFAPQHGKPAIGVQYN